MIIRCRRLAGLLLVLCALLAAPGQAAAQAERVRDLAVEITVREDGALDVVETIDIVAAGQAIRHGITRSIPTRELTPAGFNRIAGLRILRVERDGRPEPVAQVPLEAGLRLVIGDPQRRLEPGQYRYVIAYRITRQLFHAEGEDVLRWNVAMHDSDFPVDRATLLLRLPGTTRPATVSGWTGPRGSPRQDVVVLDRGEGFVQLATTRPLRAREGFTAAVSWPDGVVARPSARQESAAWQADNSGVMPGVLLLAVLLAYCAVTWWRVGRDARPQAVAPRPEPPGDLSPVAIGALWHNGFDDAFPIGRALSVALTSLAVRGAIRIEETPPGFTVQRIAPDAAGLPADEAAVLDALFPAGASDRLAFGAAFEPRMAAAGGVLRQSFDGAWLRRFRRANLKQAAIACALALAAMLSFLVPDAQGQDGGFIAGALTVMGFGMFIGSVLLALLAASRWHALAGMPKPRRILRTLPHALLVLGPLLLGLLPFLGLTNIVAPAALLLALLAPAIALPFVLLVRAVTPEGRALLDGLEGYRRHLAGEGPGLPDGSDPAASQAFYERHLAAAMAFGLEERWTERLLRPLHVAGTAPAPGHTPAWLRDDPFDERRGRTRESFSGSLATAAARAATQPGSSSGGGSDSGGSSGSGRGGGGLGGW